MSSNPHARGPNQIAYSPLEGRRSVVHQWLSGKEKRLSEEIAILTSGEGVKEVIFVTRRLQDLN
jgi:hypothetical protein